MTHDGLRSDLIRTSLERCHPLIREWDVAGRLEHALAAEIDVDLERVDDPAWAKQFRDAVPIPGHTPDRYNSRIFDIADRTVLTHIAFLGMDPTRPFVNVARTTAPVASEAERDEVAAHVLGAFTSFKPTRVRFSQPAHLRYQFDGCDGDMRLIAGPLERMRSADVAGADRVELRVATGLGWYERYAGIYGELYEERAWLRDVARIETREDLQDHIDHGLLFEIHVDGVWAGITAAEGGSRDGLHGYSVTEIILDGAYRGQSLGAAVQTRLARRLPNEQNAVLFGTIGALNTPAQRAAISAGRVDVAGDFWVNPPA